MPYAGDLFSATDHRHKIRSMSVYLGIDIGTSGTKTLAIDPTGRILAESNSLYPCHHPRPLWSEQDPEDWWQATIKTVRDVVRKARLKPADVKAIGLSGQMHGSVFLDEKDRVIRTAAECDEIEQRVGGRRRLIKLVANPALTGFTAPKILWLRNHEPRHYERTRKILLPKDDVRRRMTGEYATDVSDASGMLLLDVKRRDWSKPLLAALEIDPALLARCHESEEVTGTLTPDAAKILGLTTKCLVVGGAGDCAANGVGTGIVSRGALSTSIGTSGIMFVHSDDVTIDPLGRLHTFCHAVRGKWHMMGVSLSGGGCFQWFRNKLCPAEIAQARRSRIDPYEILTAEAEKVPPGSEGLFFLPYLSGERTPHADPDARACFIGLTLAHGRGHMVRAIMEGVAYAMRDSLEIIRSLGVPVRQIRASGGGSRSPLWRQIQADVFGQKVVSIQAEQGPAYGVALLAAVGAGAFKSVEEACKATIRVVKETPADRGATKYYDGGFPIYRELYQSLKDQFKQISALERRSHVTVRPEPVAASA
jgi:xylulokinase